MKDAMTYANEAGFFSFNVVGWKAEFERLVDAVRADEREACAKACEEYDGTLHQWTDKGKAFAAAIRGMK